MPWRILPLMMLFVALAHFNRISIAVAGAEKIIPDGLISAEGMGLIYTAFLIVYTLCMVPGGWFLDRFGPRVAWLVVAGGSAVFAAGTGLVGWHYADSTLLFPALLAVRCGFGIVCAPLHPTAARLVANWTRPAATDFVNGLINAGALLGIAFTYVLFGELIDHFGWPHAFTIAGGFTLAVAVTWFCFGADRPAADVPGHEAAVRPVPDEGRLAYGWNPTTSSLLFLTLSYGLLGYFQYLFFYWAEYYFKNQMQLSTEESRWSSTLLTLAMAAGMASGGWLSDRVRRRAGRWGQAATPILGLGVAGAATLWSMGDRTPSEIVGALAVAMGAAGLCEGAYWTTAVRLGRKHGGTAAAIMNTAGNAIGLLAPALTPWISDRFGWSASLGLAALVCWIAAVCWLGVRPPDHDRSIS